MTMALGRSSDISSLTYLKIDVKSVPPPPYGVIDLNCATVLKGIGGVTSVSKKPNFPLRFPLNYSNALFNSP